VFGDPCGSTGQNQLIVILFSRAAESDPKLCLDRSHLQRRDDHWAIIDLFGKGGHVRPVPVPAWVKLAIDSWVAIAGIDSGIIFRCVSRTGECGAAASVRKRSGGSFVNTQSSRALTIWLRMICAGLAHGCVIPQEGNLNRFSSCSATVP
jgi:hypothetical protein